MQIKCNSNQSAIKLKSNAIGIIKYKSNVPCLSNTNQMPASPNTHQMYSKSNTIQINIKCEWDYQIQIKCALVIKYKSNAHNIKCISNILQIKWQSNTTSTIKCNSNTDQISIKWGWKIKCKGLNQMLIKCQKHLIAIWLLFDSHLIAIWLAFDFHLLMCTYPLIRVKWSYVMCIHRRTWHTHIWMWTFIGVGITIGGSTPSASAAWLRLLLSSLSSIGLKSTCRSASTISSDFRDILGIATALGWCWCAKWTVEALRHCRSSFLSPARLGLAGFCPLEPLKLRAAVNTFLYVSEVDKWTGDKEIRLEEHWINLVSRELQDSPTTLINGKENRQLCNLLTKFRFRPLALTIYLVCLRAIWIWSWLSSPLGCDCAKSMPDVERAVAPTRSFM